MENFYATAKLKAGLFALNGISKKANIVFTLLLLTISIVRAQAPVISYSSPQTYTQGTAITTLSPTNSGGAVPGYGYSSTINIGSGFNFNNTPFSGSTREVAIGMAADAAGNVYVADYGNNAVKKIPVAGGAPVVIGSGFIHPTGVAVDAAGNVYVADNGNNVLKEIPAGGGPTVTIASGFINIWCVGTDHAGNIYVGDCDLSGVNNHSAIYRIPAGGGTKVLLGTGPSAQTFSMFVDTAGNVYIDRDDKIYEIPVNKTLTPLPGKENGILGVALDGAGSIIVSIGGTTGYPFKGNFGDESITIATFPGQQGLALGYDGKIYAQSPSYDYIQEIIPSGGYIITPSLPAGLVFNNNTGTIAGTPTTTSPATTYTITAYNSSGSSSANVNITVVSAPNNANLASLTLSSGTLSPTFAAATISYTASVANSVSSITVTPVTSDPSATVTVNGAAVAYGATSGPISLAVGSNTITTKVTSHDGTVNKTYTVKVTRALSSNADLSAIGLSYGTLSPAFAAGTTSYTVGVGSAIPSIKITPTVADGTATVKVNGTTVASGTASAAILLSVGPNAIPVVVTAQNGSQKTYNVTVNKGSANANLSNLVLSGVTLNPAFLTSKLNYTGGVPYATTSLTVTPTTTDAGATVKVNGTTVASGSASGAISLTVGANTISTVVTSQNGLVTVTYTVTVNRAAPAKNAALTFMQLNNATLSPAFHYTTYSYTAGVSNATTSTRVTVTVSDSNATVKVNGTTVRPRVASPPIALAVGANTINTVVTAQDGTTTQTYTITVTRASGPVNIPDESISVVQSPTTPPIENDGVVVHAGVSPNGDGINDFLTIDGISNYPDNKLTILNRNGALVFEGRGYDNSNRVFDGHSTKTGRLQLPGTYYFSLEYTVNGVIKHKTGYVVLKY